MPDQVEPLLQRIVTDSGQRDRGIERELLVAAEHAEHVGVLVAAEPREQRHGVLDLVAAAGGQEDLPQLRIQLHRIRRRLGREPVAQPVDPAADAALAEERAQVRAGRTVRLRRERSECLVDLLDRRTILLGSLHAAHQALERARRPAHLSLRHQSLVGEDLAALGQPLALRAHVRIDVLEDRAGLLPAPEDARDHGVDVVDRSPRRVRSRT